MKNVKKVLVIVVCLIVCSSVASADVITFMEGQDIGTETYTGAYDKLMYEEAPDLARGSATGYWPIYLRSPGSNNQITGIFQFTNLEDYLADGFVVDSVRMGLTVYTAANADMQVHAHELLKPWHPILATWAVDGLGNNWASGGALGPDTDRAAIAMDTTPILMTDAPGTVLWCDLDAAVVQNWIDNPSSNYGTQVSMDGAHTKQCSFVGTAGGGGTYHLQRPQLEITGVPEPATMALLGAGLCFIRRRKK